MDLTCLLYILIVVLLLGFVFIKFMSWNHDFFEKRGIETPPRSKIFGNLGQVMELGVFGIQTHNYQMFKDKKMYGWFYTRRPVLIIRDLDVVKDVMVKNFSCFVNRRTVIDSEVPFNKSLLALKGDHWKKVRNAVSPTFSTGRIKRMFPHIERNSKSLIDCLREKQERNEEIELKDIFSLFTMDVIASTGFGIEANSLKEPNNDFSTHAKKAIAGKPGLLMVLLFFPELANILPKLGINFFDKKAKDFFIKIVDSAIQTRKEEGQTGKYNDFVDLVINAEQEAAEAAKSLTREEIYGQTLIFIFAGYDTVSTVLSFTVFLLAAHPEICKKVQKEIDEKLGSEFPTCDSVQNLTYLEMCISESIRIFPPAMFIDRECSQDTELHGVQIPKGLQVLIPIYAIHHDPDLWSEPEKFNPERFSPENKVHHHPYAFLPFGQGPRNCIGMRLGQLELRVALAAVLQKFTPVACDKTVYPPKLNKMALKADDGLWVKFEPRK